MSRTEPVTASGSVEHRQVALVDLLDRLLGDGVVLTGDITLSIADVDLVHISLRAILSSVSAGLPGLVERPRL